VEERGSGRLGAEDERRIEELLKGAFGPGSAAASARLPELGEGEADEPARRAFVAGLVEGLDLGSVRRALDSFSEVSGMAMALVSSSGELLVATRWQPICSGFYRAHPRTRRACEETDQAVNAAVIAASAPGAGPAPGPYRYHCANGLREIAQPLFIEGCHWATIYIGQFLYGDEEPDEAGLAREAGELGWDAASFLEAARAVPRFSREEVERALGFCVAFGDLVSRLNHGYYRERRLARHYLEVEKALAGALEQKNFLFAELQHRVKNSLSLIASLLSLEAASQEDERARRAFDDAKGRIRSIALLYERLYRTGSAESVELGPYLSEAARASIASLAGAAPLLELDCAPLRMDSRRAIYLGLVVNELVVNALKYAFAEGRPGRLRIELRAEGGGGLLSVADDGPGLPAGFCLDSEESLGFLILRTLAKQLEGEIEAGVGLDRASGGPPGGGCRGASFVLRFPL